MGEGGLKETDQGLYRALFEASPVAMWLYDQERLTILAANDAASLLYGWTREEFLSMTARDLFVGIDSAELARSFAEMTRPAGSTAQGRFEGSDRQARGRVLATLTRGPAPRASFEPRIVAGLVADRLVTLDGDSVRLP